MTAVTVDTTAGGTSIATAKNRDFIHLYNAGSVTLYVKYDGSADVLTANNGMPIAAGDYLVLNNDGDKRTFVHPVLGITASSSVIVRVQEA